MSSGVNSQGVLIIAAWEETVEGTLLDRLVSRPQLSLKEFQRKVFYTLALICKEAAEDRKTYQQANQQSIPEVITEPVSTLEGVTQLEYNLRSPENRKQMVRFQL